MSALADVSVGQAVPVGRAAPGGQAVPGGEAATWPLSPVEELDWYLENPRDPSLVQFETHVRGHLDQTALGRALAGVLAADPVARRRLAPSSPWRRHLRWEVPPPAGQDVPLAVASWRDRDELDALRESLTATPIPLRRCALRLTLAVGPGRDALFLQVHHAAFDGISGLALMSAICAAYRERLAAPGEPGGAGAAGAVGGPGAVGGAATAVAPDFCRVSSGNRGRIEAASAFRIPGAVLRIAPRVTGPARPGYGFAQWTAPVPRPAPASRPAPDGAAPVPRPAPAARPAPDGATPGPTVNDVLVAALILAVHRWALAHRLPRGRISIAVPVNVRDERHRWTGPGNQSRLIRVTARPGDCEHPAGLLALVAEQTRAARERPRPGLDGASRLLAVGWAPTGLKRVVIRLARRLASPLATDTALVSNLGMIPAPLEPLWFSGPAPMPRGLGLGALTVGGRLHLTLVYSRALFDAAAGADFAAVYRRALEELAPRAPVHDQPRYQDQPRYHDQPPARPEREPT